jgi:hypothetical protein
MEFLRSLFGGDKFPELTDLIAAVNLLRQSGLAIADSDIKAFGDQFGRFVNSQAATVKEGLAKITGAGNHQIRSMRQLFDTTEALVNDLGALRAQFQDLTDKTRNATATKAAADQSKAQYDALEEKHAALQKKDEASPALSASAERLEEARVKMERDAEIARVAEGECTEIRANYRKNFIDTLVTALNQAVDAKISELGELSVAAADIDEALATIAEYEDGYIPKLKARLEDLNAIEVE